MKLISKDREKYNLLYGTSYVIVTNIVSELSSKA